MSGIPNFDLSPSSVSSVLRFLFHLLRTPPQACHPWALPAPSSNVLCCLPFWDKDNLWPIKPH